MNSVDLPEHPLFTYPELLQEFKRDANLIDPNFNTDEYGAGFSNNMYNRLQSQPDFRDWIWGNVDAKQATMPVAPSQASALLLRHFQWDEVTKMFKGRSSFPYGFDNPSAWDNIIDGVFLDKDRKQQFEIDFKIYNAVSNIVERYFDDWFIINTVLRKRFGRIPLSGMDYGSSLNIGFPWILTRTDPQQVDNLAHPTPKLIGSNAEKAAFQAILNGIRPEPFGYLTGVDLWSLGDELHYSWAKACRNPKEYTNSTVLRQDEFLEAERDRLRIPLCIANLALPNGGVIYQEPRSQPMPPEQKFHFAIVNFVGYTQKPEEWQNILQNIDDRLVDGGIIMEMGHSELKNTDFNGPYDQVKFLADWRKPYSVHTHMKDKGPDNLWTTFATHENGRALDVVPEGQFTAMLHDRSCLR